MKSINYKGENLEEKNIVEFKCNGELKIPMFVEKTEAIEAMEGKREEANERRGMRESWRGERRENLCVYAIWFTILLNFSSILRKQNYGNAGILDSRHKPRW